MRKAPIAAIVIALVPCWLSAETPLSRAALQELCRDHAQRPANGAARACEVYILGYLDGLRSDATIEPRPPDAGIERESWSERAARTRLGRAGIERAQPRDRLCVPDITPVTEIIGRLVAYLEEHSHRRDAPASEAIAETLRLHYTCRK